MNKITITSEMQLLITDKTDLESKLHGLNMINIYNLSREDRYKMNLDIYTTQTELLRTNKLLEKLKEKNAGI